MTVDFNNTKIAFAYKSNKALIHAYTMYRLINLPFVTKWGTSLADSLIKANIKKPLAWGMQPTIYKLFCGGKDLRASEKKIIQLYKYNVKTIADYGIEGKKSDDDFIQTSAAIQEAIHYAANHDSVPFVSSKFTGLLPIHILEKLQLEQILTAEEDKAYNKFLQKIYALSNLAYESKVSLFVDAEESWIQNPLDELSTTLMEKFNTQLPIIYNTIQLYRKDRLDFLKTSHEFAVSKGFIYAIKLVRGAYMEKEEKRAADMEYASPIHNSKIDTDTDYNAALEYIVQHLDTISVCVATHNEYSSMKMIQLMEQWNIPKNHKHVHFAQLYGMGDHISFNLAHAGYNVTKYMPYGPVKEVIPYLIRRAQENSSVAGQMGRELKLISQEIRRRNLLML